MATPATRTTFFIYLNPKTDRFHFMPWGADALFRKRGMLNFEFRAPISVKTKGRLAYRLYQLPEGRERYRKTLHGLLKEHWNEKNLLAECDRIEALIKPHLNREQNRFSRSLDGTRDFIDARRRDIMKETEGRNANMAQGTQATACHRRHRQN